MAKYFLFLSLAVATVCAVPPVHVSVAQTTKYPYVGQQGVHPVVQPGVHPVAYPTHPTVVSEHEKPVAQITYQESDVNPDGSFHNVWQADNGIQVQEQGTVHQVDDKTVVTVVGEIAYVDHNGTQYHLKYVADENGFHPEGTHLPTPPPLPVAIARSLEFIAAHPYHEENVDTASGVIVDN